jgi:hypothetical protein
VTREKTVNNAAKCDALVLNLLVRVRPHTRVRTMWRRAESEVSQFAINEAFNIN